MCNPVDSLCTNSQRCMQGRRGRPSTEFPGSSSLIQQSICCQTLLPPHVPTHRRAAAILLPLALRTAMPWITCSLMLPWPNTSARRESISASDRSCRLSLMQQGAGQSSRECVCWAPACCIVDAQSVICSVSWKCCASHSVCESSPMRESGSCLNMDHQKRLYK